MTELLGKVVAGTDRPPEMTSHPFPFPDGSEEELHYRNRGILIVDDEQGIRKSLRLYLESLGFKAAEAADAEKAMDLIEKEDYFLCLTDITGETHCRVRETWPGNRDGQPEPGVSRRVRVCAGSRR